MINRTEFNGFHDVFSESKYGKRLAGDQRYKIYRDRAGLAPDEWRNILGPDVNNLEHMPDTKTIAVMYVRYAEVHQPDLLTDEDKRLLLLTATVHDWGEAIRGDISFAYKTPEDERLEMSDFTLISHELFEGGEVELLAKAHEIAFSHGKKEDVEEETLGMRLGNIFYSIEQLGYLRTALRSFEYVLKHQDAQGHDEEGFGDTNNAMKWLFTDVFGNQIKNLLENSTLYSPVEAYLANRASKITQAFELMEQGYKPVFANYSEEKRPGAINKFLDASAAWRASVFYSPSSLES